MNGVTLYSNGTAVISREHAFPEGRPVRVAIPVRKSDLDDVVSSIAVFGDVAVAEPPTYVPTNARETELALNPAAVLKDMATKLAGAAVEVEAGSTYVGTLVGLHTCRRAVEGSVVDEGRLVVLTEKGVQQVPEHAVTAIRFTDPLVRSEIDKALQASLSKVRPDSSLVELTLAPNGPGAKAVVQYATPVAAWKIRYQLRLADGKAELDGQAVVDNDTDDDWTDAWITAVTGEPITFSTDLAETRRPHRSRVELVSEEATGAVFAAAPVAMAAAGAAARYPVSDEEESDEGTSVESMLLGFPTERADQEQAEARESGDFTVFRSAQPFSIAAGRSAIIPLFRVTLGDARPVLYFKEASDPQRPFRAVRLRNDATHSLGRGVCEISIDGDFQGKCVLEPTKPGGDALLIHAKETGVRVFKTRELSESRTLSVGFSEGTAYCEEQSRRKTVYQIRNSHPTPFTLVIEHPRWWQNSQFAVATSAGRAEAEDAVGGQRITVSLEVSGQLKVDVAETEVRRQTWALGDDWLRRYVIDRRHPIAASPEIDQCLKRQKRIDALQSEIDEKAKSAKNLEAEQTRLLKLIPSAHQEQANLWRTDLATAETELREIKKTALPSLKRQLEAAREDLQESLRRLQFQWHDGGDAVLE